MNTQTPLEERWNWITHAIGFLLTILGLYVMINDKSNNSQYTDLTIVIYAFSLMALYLSSTLYHYITNPESKKRLRIADHISIYLLIAGTYTPVTLITLSEDHQGWLLFILVWTIAGLGTILKLFFTGRFKVFSLLLYVIMGWLIIIDIKALNAIIGTQGMTYLTFGGFFYMFGIIFYVWEKLYFNHVVWHLFVLAGSLSHFIFIWKFII